MMPDEARYGIPVGNSVAVVGDPGTGKTMLLLSFFTCGKVQDGCVVLDGSGKDDSPLAVFDRLFLPQAPANEARQEGQSKNANDAAESQDTSESVPEQDDKNHHLRCFVSLESGYSRLRSHYGNILDRLMEGRGEEKERDAVVVVDATSMLSGRLEDMLRYPRLQQSSKNHGSTKVENITLHLSPCGSAGDQSGRCWFWQDNNGHDRTLEELLEPGSPLIEALCEGLLISITLLCPPVTDTGERVRLLKDLLAILFAARAARQNSQQESQQNSNSYDKRILALDSLSALLHEFRAGPLNPDHAPRRLHMLNLVRWLEEQGVTSFMACEARRLENNTLRGHPLFLGTEERYLSSGVIQLDYHRYPSGDLMRYLRVLKMRGAAHDMRGYAYDLNEKGLAWLEPLFGGAQQGDS